MLCTIGIISWVRWWKVETPAENEKEREKKVATNDVRGGSWEKATPRSDVIAYVRDHPGKHYQQLVRLAPQFSVGALLYGT